MSASTIEDVGRSRGGSRSLASFLQHALEMWLIGLLVVTAGIIIFQHRIFGRDVVVADATARNYGHFGYSDQANGGKSTFRASPQPLAWSCDLRPGWRWLLCGYEVVLDGDGARRGVDLRNLESVRLTLDYHGPAKTLRVFLKNEDPRYGAHGDRASAKVNKVEFSAHQGRQTLEFRPHEFSVADWWLSGKNFAPELGRTQLDDVVSVEISTGSEAPPGHYDFRIRSLTLTRSSIAPAQLYLVVLVVWAALIGLYLLIRVQRARLERHEKERTQAQVQAALAEAKDAAERANAAKSNFLASVSHELRTPLNAVIGYSQVLERGALDEEQLSAVRTIHRSGDHLLSLITELLDLSKIEAGKMELHRAPTDLRGMVSHVVEMVRVRAQDKGLVFSCVLDPNLPEGIEADETRLRQILLNLLSNAIKFTASGRVSLVLSRIEGDAGAALIRFEVQDSGPGIPEAEIERIFRPFEQAGDAQSQAGGTGLGLAITGQLAALMGAAIEVDSRVGEGARFWFDARFPVVDSPADARPRGEAAEAAAGQAGSAPDAERPLRVLAAEDNPTNQQVLRAVLKDINVELQLVSNGVEAVAAFQAFSFDVVLMDVQMPEMGGIDATRAIRTYEAGCGRARTPIIALSANAMADHIAEYRAAGMDGHLEKPIDIKQLYAALANLPAPGPTDLQLTA